MKEQNIEEKAKRYDKVVAQGNESTDTCDSSIIKGKEFPASEKRDFSYFRKPTDKVEPKFKVGDKI